jgi:hypothetical protein
MDDFDDVEDGFDEICNASTRQTADEEFVAAGGSLSRYRKTELGSPVNGQPIQKLEDRRWTDHLRRHDERDVIRAAKAGDPAAKDRLYRCFNKKLRRSPVTSNMAAPHSVNGYLPQGWASSKRSVDTIQAATMDFGHTLQSSFGALLSIASMTGTTVAARGKLGMSARSVPSIARSMFNTMALKVSITISRAVSRSVRRSRVG